MQVATQWGRVLPRPQRCCSCLRRIGTAPAPSTVLLSCAGAAAVPANVCDTLFVLHGSGGQWLKSWSRTESVPSRRMVRTLAASSPTGTACGGTRSGTGLSIGRWGGAGSVASPRDGSIRPPASDQRGRGRGEWASVLCLAVTAKVACATLQNAERGRTVATCGPTRGILPRSFGLWAWREERRQPPRLLLLLRAPDRWGRGRGEGTSVLCLGLTAAVACVTQGVVRRGSTMLH